MTDNSRAYVDVRQVLDTAAEAERRLGEGEIVMLNLLRFRVIADYSATPALAPQTPISGAAAYDHYLALCAPRMKARGNEYFLLGKPGNFLIGPQDEQWDFVLMVRWPSLAAMRASPSDPDYVARIAPHRTAAVEDSRLLPILPIPVG